VARARRLDQINALKPANLFDFKSLTLKFRSEQIDRFKTVTRQERGLARLGTVPKSGLPEPYIFPTVCCNKTVRLIDYPDSMPRTLRDRKDDFTDYRQPEPSEKLESNARAEGRDRFRIQECYCFAKERISQTVRRLEKADDQPAGPRSGLPKKWKSESKAYGPVTTNDVADLLINRFCPSSRGSAAGLVVISGSTKSKKSRIVRNLIHNYLEMRLKEPRERRPHVVTYEDPIESLLLTADEVMDESRVIDYTPREKGKDAADLSEVIRDALRQTPTVLYAGEIRERADWKEVIHFAGTGHFAVTTTHADSVQECLAHILEANEANSSSARSVVASRLLAVAHIRSIPLLTTPEQTVPLPALWYRTSGSVMRFVSQGLSSVLPNRPASEQQDPGSLGRAWFAHKWEKLMQPNDYTRVVQEAIRCDLEGR
jgi:hypothetical protein